MTQQRYHIIGMTCARCAKSIERQVGEVFGVTAVRLDLRCSEVTVAGEALDSARICAAIARAGFEVAAVL